MLEMGDGMQKVMIRFFNKELGYEAAKFLKNLGYQVSTIGKTYWIDEYPIISCLILEVDYE